MSAYEELLGAMLGQRPIRTKGNAMRLIAARDAEHAHTLAERQRAYEGPSMTMGGNRMVSLELITDLIDPEVPQ